jgi:tellurite resistance-related uncharacterized protein
VLRNIVGFRQDDEGHWVAELDCLHRQHVRHQPPFWDRAWVTSEPGRAERIGAVLNCPLCDRAELPEELRVVRTAGPFDAASLPAGLRKNHQVAHRTWGNLRVIEGTVYFSMETDPPISVLLVADQEQAIPPGVPHRLHVEAPMVIAVDFYVRADNEAE